MSIIRPHKKSRNGCEGCKRRKIKCDEVHPKCSFCSSRRVQCVYPIKIAKATKSQAGNSSPPSSQQVSSSSPRPVAPSPIETQLSLNIGVKNMQELRLMHNYSTVLSPFMSLSSLDTMNETAKVWQMEIPQLAFESEFLMNTLFCLSSHHLQTQMEKAGGDVVMQARQTDHYLDLALRGYRQSVSSINDFQNIEAILAASMMFLILTTTHYVMHVDGEMWVVSFLTLHAGMRSLESLWGKENLSRSSLYPLLGMGDRLSSESPFVPPILQELLNPLESPNLTPEQLYILYETLQCLGKLYNLLRSLTSRQAQVLLFMKIGAAGKEFPVQYVSLVKERLPQALVILAHYLSFLRIIAMHGFWGDNVMSDAKSIIYSLDPKWERFMETPTRIFCADSSLDHAAVIMELVHQLPGQPTTTDSAGGASSMGGGSVEDITDDSAPSESYGVEKLRHDLPIDLERRALRSSPPVQAASPSSQSLG